MNWRRPKARSPAAVSCCPDWLCEPICVSRLATASTSPWRCTRWRPRVDALRTPGTPTTELIGGVAFYPAGLAVAWAYWRSSGLSGLDNRTRTGWLLLSVSALVLSISGTSWALLPRLGGGCPAGWTCSRWRRAWRRWRHISRSRDGPSATAPHACSTSPWSPSRGRRWPCTRGRLWMAALPAVALDGRPGAWPRLAHPRDCGYRHGEEA